MRRWHENNRYSCVPYAWLYHQLYKRNATKKLFSKLVVVGSTICKQHHSHRITGKVRTESPFRGSHEQLCRLATAPISGDNFESSMHAILTVVSKHFRKNSGTFRHPNAFEACKDEMGILPENRHFFWSGFRELLHTYTGIRYTPSTA